MPDFQAPTFKTFLMAGYECTYALVEQRERFDLLAASKHDVYCRPDYELIKELGMTTVREGLAWHQIDRGKGAYDFSRFEPMMQAAQDLGIQQIWDLNHSDFSEKLNVFSQAFVQRFAEYARAVIHTLRKFQRETIYLVPLNEISFFSWIGADHGLWAPYKTGAVNGFGFKKQLVQAAMKARLPI